MKYARIVIQRDHVDPKAVECSIRFGRFGPVVGCAWCGRANAVRATALSFNVCPHFAHPLSHHRPRSIDFIGAASILTREKTQY